MIAAFLVIAFSGGTQDSGAEPTSSLPVTSKPAPEKCSAHKAVKFYAGRIAHWRSLLGAGARPGKFATRLGPVGSGRPHACPRYLAGVLQRKAYHLRRAWNRWFHYHYAWSEWLPDKYARVGACETGYGKRPGSWSWDSGTYVSAFGIYRPAYEQFARAVGVPSWSTRHTPRDQFTVASAIQARFGWGAWGCGAA